MAAARERSAAVSEVGFSAEATGSMAAAMAEEMVVARAGARSAGTERWEAPEVVWAEDLELEEGACWHAACRRPAIGSRTQEGTAVASTAMVPEVAKVAALAAAACLVGPEAGRAP